MGIFTSDKNRDTKQEIIDLIREGRREELDEAIYRLEAIKHDRFRRTLYRLLMGEQQDRAIKLVRAIDDVTLRPIWAWFVIVMMTVGFLLLIWSSVTININVG